MRKQTAASLRAVAVLGMLFAFTMADGCADDPAPVPTTKGGGGASGKAGSAGASGKAGTAGGGASGGSGTSGASGISAGSGGSGAGGGPAAGGAAGGVTGGGAGEGGACATKADCPATVSTLPTGCAEASCNAGVCGFVARDADGDGFRSSRCKASDTSIGVIVGDDCDDANAAISPGGWDGPAGEGKPDHCKDGIDQNCSGVPDDQKLKNGATCTCSPGDVADCAEDEGGKPVVFPLLEGGKPLLPCVFGKKTCLSGGVWGACGGVKAPVSEVCDKKDNDCNGKIDDEPKDQQYWLWDADGDLHGAKDCAPVLGCKDTPPATPPKDCPSGSCQGEACPKPAWRLAASITADDCDDTSSKSFGSGAEVCDGVDNDCNGKVDEGFNLGAKCDVGDSPEGACAGGGTIACKGGDADCAPTEAGIGIAAFHPGRAANFSQDWNCDGTVELHIFGAAGDLGQPVPGANRVVVTTSSCDTLEASNVGCGELTDDPPCSGATVFVLCTKASPNGLSCSTPGKALACKWDGLAKVCRFGAVKEDVLLHCR